MHTTSESIPEGMRLETMVQARCPKPARQAGWTVPSVLHVSRDGGSTISAGTALPHAAQGTVSHLHRKGALLACSQCVIHQHPQDLLHRAAFQLVGPILSWAIPAQVQDMHIPLLNPTRLL